MSSTSSASSTSTSSSSGNNYDNGQGSTPLSVFTFVIAIALFVIVVAFVLLRICMRNRRLRRMGIIADGPIDRFLSGQPIPGFREIDDTVNPPKLWGARIRPPTSAAASSAAPNEKSGWENLVPLAASLPTCLFSETGAIATVGNEDANKEEVNTAKARDPNEQIQSSVNVSVLIAMPSAPKDDGSDELPELMLGTAAVPIYSRVPTAQSTTNATSHTPAAQPVQTSSGGGGYFSIMPHATQAPIATQHPTRAQLLTLYKAAREAKERAKAQREAEAKALAEENGTTNDEADAEAQRRSSSLPSHHDQTATREAPIPQEIPMQSMPNMSRI